MKSLTPRMQLIAVLAATGLPNLEVAQRVGCTPHMVASVLRKPEVIALMEQTCAQVLGGIVGTAEETLIGDLPRQVKRAIALSSQDDDLGVATRATFGLLDRTLPAKTVKEESRTVRVIVAREELRDLKVIDAEARALEEP